MNTPTRNPLDAPEPLGENLSPTEEPLGSLDTGGLPLTGRKKPSVSNPLGKEGFDRQALKAYVVKPLEDKRNHLRDEWLTLAYLLLGKANSLALTCTKKDYGRLVQILTSAGIAHDKVFPKVNDPATGTLVFNMFKSLPTEKVLRVIGGSPIPSGEPLEGKPLEVSIPLPPNK
jgi:hypothetical protein